MTKSNENALAETVVDDGEKTAVAIAPVATQTPIQALLARMTAHDTEQAAIDAEMARLNLDAKAIKKIRRAAEDAERAQKTLAELMGAGLVP